MKHLQRHIMNNFSIQSLYIIFLCAFYFFGSIVFIYLSNPLAWTQFSACLLLENLLYSLMTQLHSPTFPLHFKNRNSFWETISVSINSVLLSNNSNDLLDQHLKAAYCFLGFLFLSMNFSDLSSKSLQKFQRTKLYSISLISAFQMEMRG